MTLDLFMWIGLMLLACGGAWGLGRFVAVFQEFLKWRAHGKQVPGSRTETAAGVPPLTQEKGAGTQTAAREAYRAQPKPGGMEQAHSVGERPLGELILQSAVLFALVLTVSLMRGFVVMKYWEWFVAGHFNLSLLPLRSAVGIALVVVYLVRGGNSEHQLKEGETQTWFMLRNVGGGFMWAFVLFLMGYLIHVA